MQHRKAISDWIVAHKFKTILDFGGGFGSLAKLLASKDKDLTIHLYEPFPSEYTLKKLSKFQNIKFIDKLNDNYYDCLVCIDVLEHLEDPLATLYSLIKSVKINGYLIIANAFYPMIKCHLPKNFHLRYTFDLFARLMGLEVIGPLKGSHATIYRKIKDSEPYWYKVSMLENISKSIFPFLEIIHLSFKFAKYVIKKLRGE
ncbi:MAG: methyltransferase domain-containing protein [bacterium]